MGYTVITVGNSAPHELLPHDDANLAHQQRLIDRGGDVVEFEGAPHHKVDLELGNNTEIHFPDDQPIAHVLPTLQKLWAKHSSQSGNWVVVEGHVTEDGDGPADEASLASRAALIKALVEAHFDIRQASVDELTMLVTNAGLDFIAKQLSGVASATTIAKYMALTANASAAAAGDTTLTAEITTGGGGLIRAAATYAHTGSASTYTLTITYTANGSDSLPVTIAKIGVFDASSTGNLVFETLLSATATLSASGDQLTVTETVTI